MSGILDGILKGGASGAAAGPEGALVGAGLGLATGIIQNIGAASAKKKADAAMPPLIDPRQAAFLSELNQKRKAIDTGAAFGAGTNAVNNLNASTNSAISQAAGGDVGGTTQGLLQSQAVANSGENNVLAQGQGQQLAYNSMFNALNNKISDRQTQLELLDSQQKRAEWAQKKQMANQNMMAGVSGHHSSGGGNGSAPAQTDDASAGTATGGSNAGVADFIKSLNIGGAI